MQFFAIMLFFKKARKSFILENKKPCFLGVRFDTDVLTKVFQVEGGCA